jgi:hypothetical protein
MFQNPLRFFALSAVFLPKSTPPKKNRASPKGRPIHISVCSTSLALHDFGHKAPCFATHLEVINAICEGIQVEAFLEDAARMVAVA